ncbi:MAG: diacylglycerol kinase family protein [Candidatus Electryonea clarkiae]|nr:diacylglycerol kinase family protein [Candidatus Electryonea clarkiae]MDP8285529.1 diacylglycerol kinase family protein [Candidatus Electryonea clarkiae]
MSDYTQVRKVRAIFNPKSGLWWSMVGVRKALDENWDVPGIDLTYQISKNPEDGRDKTLRAIDDGVDTVIVVGGDGMVHSIGGVLVGTDTALAVLPAGSGNGFARHFDIPLTPEKAARVLSAGKRQKIDVGVIGDHPFLVTCGLAWDAALVEEFVKYPIRGILPYVFAGIGKFFTYDPQVFSLTLDGKKLEIDQPLILTIANLTQFGGGAKIAPDAKSNDGELELVAILERDPVQILSQIYKLFDGSIKSVSKVKTWRFKHLKVTRERSEPIQMDGELLDISRDFEIDVWPSSLEVIIPDPEYRNGKWENN